MSAAAWVIAATLAIMFAGACIAAWLDDRAWQREFEDHREPPSRLDRADGLDDWGGWKP